MPFSKDTPGLSTGQPARLILNVINRYIAGERQAALRILANLAPAVFTLNSPKTVHKVRRA